MLTEVCLEKSVALDCGPGNEIYPLIGNGWQGMQMVAMLTVREIKPCVEGLAFEVEEVVDMEVEVEGRNERRCVCSGTRVCEVGAAHVIGAVQRVRVCAVEGVVESLSYIPRRRADRHNSRTGNHACHMQDILPPSRAT